MTESSPKLLRVTLLSHPGALRTANEDAAMVGELVLTGCLSARVFEVVTDTSEPVVVAVADGLGGHVGGEVASSAAVHALARRGSTMASGDTVAAALREVSDHITGLAAADRERSQMATTVVGLAVSDGNVHCFNVGDSPAFQLAGGYFTAISTLDSPTQAIEDAGDIAAPTGLVTQVLGPATKRLEPHVRSEPARPDSCYLLCSDGLSDLVPVSELERIVSEKPSDDSRVVRAMWATAMNAGGSDNITIALVRTG